MKLKSFSQPLYAILIATAFLIDAFMRDITGAVCCLLVYWLCKVFLLMKLAEASREMSFPVP